MTDKSFTLNTGAKIPALGLGTWQGKAEEVKAAVLHAIRTGYRLIDGAYCYGNEAAVGAGIRAALDEGVVRREDLVVVTKVWVTYATRVELGLDKSLRSLGLDYVDLFLMHWPLLMNPEGNDDRIPTLPNGERDVIRSHDHVDTWRQMEAVLKTGKAKAIGVCNYSKPYLERLLAHATVVPAVNQIENHPCLPQQEIVDLCNARGVHVMAYSPLGSTGAPVARAGPVVRIAAKHGVEASTVLLSYHLARGSTVLVKSTDPARIEANAKLIELDEEDMAALRAYSDGLAREGKLMRFVYPPFGIDFGFPDKS